MSQFLVEVTLMASNGRDWLSKGFHERGHGMPGDRFVVSGKQYALRMSLEAARRRVEFYRQRGHRARIIDSADRIVLDFDTPLIERPKFDRETMHRFWTYRGLKFIENRMTGMFYHRFAWPIEDGPERSVSGLSFEEIIERMQGMGGDILAYLVAKLDRVESPEPPPAVPPPTVPVPNIELREGEQLVGVSFRPGCMPRG